MKTIKTILVLCFVWSFVLFSNVSYLQAQEISDLEGTWDFHALTSGDSTKEPPDWIGWMYGTQNINSTGDVTVPSITRSDGDSTLPADTTMAISPSGVVTIPGTDFHGVLNSYEDMIVNTMTDGGGGYNLEISLKQGISTYSQSDLEGIWSFHTLTTGESSDWLGWLYGTQSIDSTGNATVTSITRSDGDSSIPGGTTMSISSSGVVTLSGTDFHGIMNSQKDMFVSTMDDGGGGYNLGIYLKQDISTFSQSDLEGIWDFHMLTSGDISGEPPDWIGWMYGTQSITDTGDATFTSFERSDGVSALPPDTTMAISSSGIVTMAGTDFYGMMNSRGDMFVGVMTDGGGGYNLGVYVKPIPAPGAVLLGGIGLSLAGWKLRRRKDM